VPTPAKAARVRESSIERVLKLKTHRIRRITAAEGLRILRQQPLTVAAGTAEAASAHIRAVATRLKLVNRQIKEALRYLDALCTKLTEGAGKTPTGQQPEQRDVTILRSCRATEGSSLPQCSPRLASLCAGEIITLCGPCPGSLR
jgi:hypothetical protein